MRIMSVDKVFEVVEKGKVFFGKGVVVVDLCVFEEEGFCKRFVEFIKLVKEYGYWVIIYVGEIGIGKNVLDVV